MKRMDEVISRIFLIGYAIIVPVFLCGCQTSQEYSGFLDDYSVLEPNPEVDGALYYQAPGTSLADYDKFIIEPIVVHFHPVSKAKSIDPERLLELTTVFHNEIVEVLSENYEIVEASGPGVLIVQAAITDLEENSPLFNIHPATKMLGVGLGGAAMEAKAIDSQTGDLVIAVMDSRQGDRLTLDVTAGLTAWGSAKQAVQYWANRFKDRLDEAHGN